MKFFFAKEFRISSIEFDKMYAEDIDMLCMISNIYTEKQKYDVEAQKMRR